MALWILPHMARRNFAEIVPLAGGFCGNRVMSGGFIVIVMKNVGCPIAIVNKKAWFCKFFHCNMLRVLERARRRRNAPTNKNQGTPPNFQ